MKPVSLTPTLSRDYSVLLEAAAQGTGVALARDLLVADDLDRGRLVRPFNLSFESNVQYHFVAPQQRMSQPPVLELLQWLKSAAEATVQSARPLDSRAS